MEQILISGQYNNPVGQPLAGVRIILVSRATSNSTFAGSQVVATTNEWGKYSFNIVPGRYVASALHPDRREDYLGVMEVLPGNCPGTLNDFITALVPDDARPTGEYNGDKTYNVNDLVQYEGSEYRATAQVSGVAPPLAPWELFLSRGEQGEAGKPNVLTVGNVLTLDPGKPAAAEITGDTPSQVLNLSIPRGHDGQDGETGPANMLTIGIVASSDPGAPAEAEITGDAPAQVLNLTLPRCEKWTDGKDGENGKDGAPGPANVLSIGTVETLPAGSEAVAELTGESPVQSLNLSLPAGPQGEKGETGPANQLTVGKVATLEPGSHATAEITGDAPAQMLSLGIPQGKAGEKGETGEAGPANNLIIGTVTELPAGSAPTVELEGDSPEQVLNFGFPKVESCVQIITVASGETLDPLAAAPGTYWLEPGATLHNGPESLVVEIYTCVVDVRITGKSVRLILEAHFNESSGYHHCAQCELMPGLSALWSFTGPIEGNPRTGKSFTILGVTKLSGVAVRPRTDAYRLSVLVGAKHYGLLTEQQDRELKEMIESEMKLLAV